MWRNAINFVLESFITAHNEVGARLCFHRCVWFCSQGGVCLSACWDKHPLGADTPRADTPPGADTPEQTPRGADTPRADTPRADTPRSRHPMGADTPQQQTPPEADPPREETPPGSRHPLEQTPPLQSMLGDTVNAQVVRILLECNLVLIMIALPLSIQLSWMSQIEMGLYKFEWGTWNASETKVTQKSPTNVTGNHGKTNSWLHDTYTPKH